MAVSSRFPIGDSPQRKPVMPRASGAYGARRMLRWQITGSTCSVLISRNSNSCFGRESAIRTSSFDLDD
jgi:hypothetical protein